MPFRAAHQPPATDGARRALAGVLGLQLGAVLLVAGYAVVLEQPLAPDDGLRQLDALTLREPVPGVAPLAGATTLVVATGPLDEPACAAQASLALRSRAGGTGLASEFGLLLLAPRGRVPTAEAAPAGAGTAVRADPGGALARALALPGAATDCRPGYAVVDAAGDVRYRTYDPDWAHHRQEQEVLLRAASRQAGAVR